MHGKCGCGRTDNGMRGQARVNSRHVCAHAVCLSGKEDGNPEDKKFYVQLKAISSDL
jgi:hypothetical protein